MTRVIGDLLNAVDSGKPFVLLSLDVSEVFDAPDRNCLLQRVTDLFGLTGRFPDWLRSYVSGHTSRVALGHCRSSFVDCPTGVPQGSILRPLPFAIFTTPVDCLIWTVDVSYHQYADDTQLYTSIDPSSSGDLVRLTDCDNAVARWQYENCLLLNLSCKDQSTDHRFMAAGGEAEVELYVRTSPDRCYGQVLQQGMSPKYQYQLLPDIRWSPVEFADVEEVKRFIAGTGTPYRTYVFHCESKSNRKSRWNLDVRKKFRTVNKKYLYIHPHEQKSRTKGRQEETNIQCARRYLSRVKKWVPAHINGDNSGCCVSIFLKKIWFKSVDKSLDVTLTYIFKISSNDIFIAGHSTIKFYESLVKVSHTIAQKQQFL